ncbi:trp operon leader peptide [Streptomyces sp. NPDC048496]|uniref:trp operon leader peptide n=1 Tax=Streptomyces sp. NPDC048496 TaxID=3365558 RepID=UPI003722FACF
MVLQGHRQRHRPVRRPHPGRQRLEHLQPAVLTGSSRICRGPFHLPGGAGPVSVPSWVRVQSVFAHSIQNWWWTAHPAAH